jgi:hypothetical protein
MDESRMCFPYSRILDILLRQRNKSNKVITEQEQENEKGNFVVRYSYHKGRRMSVMTDPATIACHIAKQQKTAHQAVQE